MHLWRTIALATVAGMGNVAAAQPANTPRYPIADDPGPRQAPAPSKGAAASPSPRRHTLSDKGIFPDLDARVAVVWPDWVKPADINLYLDEPKGVLTVLNDNHPVMSFPSAAGFDPTGELAFYTTGRQRRPLRVRRDGSPNQLADRDDDGIPDAVDLLLGAKKAAENGAKYQDRYHRLDYPGGDVPRTEGVCSDVIVRALRNAGIDLQRAIHEDARAHRRAYPAIARPNPNIDHRRVRNQVVWFARHFDRIPPGGPYLPGDVVFLDTLDRPGPDHVGIISDVRGESGLPLLINNWTTGFRTEPMDLLATVPITDVFRAPPRRRNEKRRAR